MEFIYLNQNQTNKASLNYFPSTTTEWNKGTKIIKDLFGQWGADLCTSFKESLLEVKNSIYHFANKFIHPDEYSIEIELFNSPFVKALNSVSSIPDVSGEPEKERPFTTEKSLF